MSEIINNREYRQRVLKELIMELHGGKKLEDVKERFEKLIEGISPSEISDMEQSLIMEGMPVSEVQRLCDVHAAVFKGSIEEIHAPKAIMDIPGHPLNTLKAENDAVEELIDNEILPDIEALRAEDNEENRNKLVSKLNTLLDIDKHYKRKENLLFPYLEKYGITAPPKVMWGVDDEIRTEIKESKAMLIDKGTDKSAIAEKVLKTVDKVKEMVFKENTILFPMTIDTLNEDEWIDIEDSSSEIGYSIVGPTGKWIPSRVNLEKKEEASLRKGYVKFETGILSMEEISSLLNTLPFDITFIDKDDIVKYFSLGKERIFARTKAVIGRTVQNCHPPASVSIVNKMLEDFKSGKKDSEDFWIRMGELYVYIRYFAVRDEYGKYLGTLEVTQNIKPIQEIKGEKRLMSE